MHLSLLWLNVGNDPDRPRPGRLWLRNPYRVHQRLSMAFPDSTTKATDPDFLKPFDPGGFLDVSVPRREKQGFLFRIDADHRGRPFILVQSAHEPDWKYAFSNARYLLDACPQVRVFDPMELLKSDQRLRFRLRANPTKKVASLLKVERLAGVGGEDGKTKNGRRLALLREEEQIAWLLEKGKQGGFRIPGEWLQGEDGRKVPNFRVDLITEGWFNCGKEGHSGGRFFAVRFDGILEVIDSNQLLQTVSHGIGSGKAFGFGLLSLARAED